MNRLLLFHMADGGTLQCYGKLEGIPHELPARLFVRCHQSFVVNVSAITQMRDSHVRIGQSAIAISKKYIKATKEQYFAYGFSQMGRGERP